MSRRQYRATLSSRSGWCLIFRHPDRDGCGWTTEAPSSTWSWPHEMSPGEQLGTPGTERDPRRLNVLEPRRHRSRGFASEVCRANNRSIL